MPPGWWERVRYGTFFARPLQGLLSVVENGMGKEAEAVEMHMVQEQRGNRRSSGRIMSCIAAKLLPNRQPPSSYRALGTACPRPARSSTLWLQPCSRVLSKFFP